MKRSRELLNGQTNGINDIGVQCEVFPCKRLARAG